MELCGLGQRIGASISGIYANAASDADLASVMEALLANRFVVMPDQQLDNNGYVGFGRRWGKPVIQPLVAAHPVNGRKALYGLGGPGSRSIRSSPPASSTTTVLPGAALSRLASTQPADPAPTTM